MDHFFIDNQGPDDTALHDALAWLVVFATDRRLDTKTKEKDLLDRLDSLG